MEYVLLKVCWSSREIKVVMTGTKEEVLEEKAKIRLTNIKKNLAVSYDLVYRKLK